MSPGSHTLTVSAHFFSDSARSGPPSNAIRLRYDPARTVEPLTERGPRTPRESDSRIAEVVAVGLTDPTDLALLPDGRALVAERSGRIRMWRDGALAVEPALALADVVTGHGRGLLAVAVDRPFDATRAVFIVYTAAGGARLARFTLAGDALVDRAVLLDGLPHAPVDPAAALLVGHDGKVYLALDDGGEPARVADAGSYSGKVLRLNRDGTTPRDTGGRTPVVAAGFARPSGLASAHEGEDVWVAGRGADGVERVDLIKARRSAEDSGAASFALPPGVEVTDISILPPEAPGREPGRALVASASGGVLRLSSAGSSVAPEWIFRDATGPVVAIDVDERGVAYVLRQERLIRLGVRR
jgi:glucose/arabinose dehydrogenase